MIAHTPEPPYTAVIFTSLRRKESGDYEAVARRMLALAEGQPGYLGAESVRDAEGWGITVSYWRDEACARAWGAVAEHREAQRMGRESFYACYALRVATVARQDGHGASL